MFIVWYSIFPDWISITCGMYRGYVLLRALRSRKTPRHGSPSIGARTKVKNVHTRFEVEDELSSFGAGRHHWVTLFLGCEGGIQPTSKAMMLEKSGEWMVKPCFVQNGPRLRFFWPIRPLKSVPMWICGRFCLFPYRILLVNPEIGQFMATSWDFSLAFWGKKNGLLKALSISGGTTGEYWW